MIDDVNRSGGVVKVLGEVGAGAVVTPFDNGELDTVFLNFRLPEDTYGAVVKGSSMLPVFEDGDLIIFGQNELSPDQAIGDTCIVYTDEGQMLIKIVMRGSSPGLYTLISTNNPPIPDIKLQWARPFEFRVSRKAWKK